MLAKRRFAAGSSLLIFAATVLAPRLFAGERKYGQAAQQGEPQKEPTAAELSKKETVGSAFLRNFQYQEYEVRSAAEAMPEEKYSYRPAEGKFKNEKPEFGLVKCARSLSRSSMWLARILRLPQNSTARSRPTAATRAAPAPRRRRKNC